MNRLTPNELAAVIYENNVEKGWWKEPNRNVGELLMLMVTELSEAMEDWRVAGDLVLQTSTSLTTSGLVLPKWHGYHFEDDGKPVGFWSEVADAIIRPLDLVGRYQVDIDQIIIDKVEYNKTRPHRHGDKHA